MKDDRDSATRYCRRAEELRLIAETMTDPGSKKALVAIADDYKAWLALASASTERPNRKR
mgnify:CR=1